MARKSKKTAHRRKSTSHVNFTNALRRLKKLKPSEQHQAMSMANNAFIKQFCKHLKKLKHAKLSPKTRKALRKHKKVIRQLIHTRTGMSKRRRILTQKGSGILGSLIRAVPIVGSVVDLIGGLTH